MNILLTGANGFIGKIVHQALSLQGHTVIRAVRCPNLPSDIAVNFEQDITAETWIPRLNNIDAIVNTVGIMGGAEAQMMAVHCYTPSALAQAAVQKNIQYYVQVSSLGVDSNVNTLYFRSKLAGEQGIRNALPKAAILRPSMVFGLEGAGTQLFVQLTRLPMIILPHAGNMNIQPVHGSDVGAGVVALLTQQVNHGNLPAQTIAAVGLDTVSMANYLKSLATQLNRKLPLRLSCILPMPLSMAQASTKLAALLPQHLWTPDTLAMLCAGSAADVAPFTDLLGRSPVALKDFVAHPTVIKQ